MLCFRDKFKLLRDKHFCTYYSGYYIEHCVHLLCFLMLLIIINLILAEMKNPKVLIVNPIFYLSTTKILCELPAIQL